MYFNNHQSHINDSFFEWKKIFGKILSIKHAIVTKIGSKKNSDSLPGMNIIFYTLFTSGQVWYGSTCRDGTSPRSPISSTPSAYSGRPPGPAQGPLTIPSYDRPTYMLTTTSWGAPAGDSIQPDPLRLGCGEQDHPLGNVPRDHRSAVGAPA